MADLSLPSEIIQVARQTARRLMVDGVLWRVYELPPSTMDRRSTPSLVFEGDQAFRRVRNYPKDWRHLSDEALLRLSWTV
jgi:hypothetical protein